ncbi:MAG: hypothetical protein ACRC8Y_21410 [Chroococcales cyanobacterium]
MLCLQRGVTWSPPSNAETTASRYYERWKRQQVVTTNVGNDSKSLLRTIPHHVLMLP